MKNFVTSRRRRIQEHYIRRAFEGMVGGVSLGTKLVKYIDNQSQGNAWGSARPNFGDENAPVDLLCLVEFEMTKENMTAWGVDESIEALATCLTSTARQLQITNKDRVIANGTEYAIQSLHESLGMGHESSVTYLRLEPVSHIKHTP